jgi:hypothetical protein
MRRYFFDMRDDDGLSLDEEGLECRDLRAVRAEAARALADMARDAVHMTTAPSVHSMSIEVRDDNGPVMQVMFKFEVTAAAGASHT